MVIVISPYFTSSVYVIRAFAFTLDKIPRPVVNLNEEFLNGKYSIPKSRIEDSIVASRSTTSSLISRSSFSKSSNLKVCQTTFAFSFGLTFLAYSNPRPGDPIEIANAFFFSISCDCPRRLKLIRKINNSCFFFHFHQF
ncbi:hypothetical protein [Polaribacter sp. 20A6]|uniref:hypothetical protein n=1 Tax=Polaribacter sp. 20A6 TaxID=2687289 RepID=UPI0013FD717D|nr:hypothetical protein [Polaribacter sp. 20A6]